jgi:hypothetical protein
MWWQSSNQQSALSTQPLHILGFPEEHPNWSTSKSAPLSAAENILGLNAEC